MNILIDELPETVIVDGRRCRINTDFKTALRVILAFEDSELTSLEKQSIMLMNIYPRPPKNVQEASDKATWFLNGGDDTTADEPGPRVCSFEKDAKYIYAAFEQTHGIDLHSAKDMHWWKFLSLFSDLGSDTFFCNLVGLRLRLKNGTATKEEKQAATKMQSVINLPELDNRTLEERQAASEFYKLWEARKQNGRNNNS